MKLFNGKNDRLYLTKDQWRKIFVLMSVMTLALYSVAMVFSLCGSNYFILNYQNAQMDRIESWLENYNLSNVVNSLFRTIEFSIIIAFVLKKFPKWYYLLAFLVLPLIPHYVFGRLPDIYYSSYPFLYYITIPLIDQLIDKGKISFKEYGFSMLRLLIAMAAVFVLQVMIYIIKSGGLTFENVILNFSAAFIYALEYDIALLVILVTISLFINREKGDSELWATSHNAGLSSQTSKKQSQKSLQKKNLTKTQISKIRLLYVKFYLTQLGAFLILMILPFVLGKVFEFLVMYLSFAIARYILGFNYSLHYKKETTCITVGVLVFGILSLAVPFFYVVLIIAITLGIGLAVLLHLSYKYKGMFLFAQVSKPDKFALLYTYFDGNLERNYVKARCKLRGLDKFETDLIVEFTSGEKLSYMAKIHHYSHRMLIYKLDEAIKKLVN